MLDNFVTRIHPNPTWNKLERERLPVQSMAVYQTHLPRKGNRRVVDGAAGTQQMVGRFPPTTSGTATTRYRWSLGNCHGAAACAAIKVWKKMEGADRCTAGSSEVQEYRSKDGKSYRLCSNNIRSSCTRAAHLRQEPSAAAQDPGRTCRIGSYHDKRSALRDGEEGAHVGMYKGERILPLHLCHSKSSRDCNTARPMCIAPASSLPHRADGRGPDGAGTTDKAGRSFLRCPNCPPSPSVSLTTDRGCHFFWCLVVSLLVAFWCLLVPFGAFWCLLVLFLFLVLFLVPLVLPCLAYTALSFAPANLHSFHTLTILVLSPPSCPFSLQRLPFFTQFFFLRSSFLPFGSPFLRLPPAIGTVHLPFSNFQLHSPNSELKLKLRLNPKSQIPNPKFQTQNPDPNPIPDPKTSSNSSILPPTANTRKARLCPC